VAPTVLRWWRRLRSSISGTQRKGIDTLFALVSWQLWKERNARCFRQENAMAVDTLQAIKREGETWIQAGAKGLEALVRG
jgi:NaMN:DMB phosphoribosyltransferase